MLRYYYGSLTAKLHWVQCVCHIQACKCQLRSLAV